MKTKRGSIELRKKKWGCNNNKGPGRWEQVNKTKQEKGRREECGVGWLAALRHWKVQVGGSQFNAPSQGRPSSALPPPPPSSSSGRRNKAPPPLPSSFQTGKKKIFTHQHLRLLWPRTRPLLSVVFGPDMQGCSLLPQLCCCALSHHQLFFICWSQLARSFYLQAPHLVTIERRKREQPPPKKKKIQREGRG